MKLERTEVKHPFPPFYQKNSEILILGTFPSIKSREEGFYYMHPKNRFWRVLSIVFEEKFPETLEEKKEFLVRHRIALWDVLESCSICGSQDYTIQNEMVNDFSSLIENSSIQRIYVTGKKANELFKKQYPHFPLPVTLLPSPSPLNCAIHLEELVKFYQILR